MIIFIVYRESGKLFGIKTSGINEIQINKSIINIVTWINKYVCIQITPIKIELVYLTT